MVCKQKGPMMLAVYCRLENATNCSAIRYTLSSKDSLRDALAWPTIVISGSRYCAGSSNCCSAGMRTNPVSYTHLRAHETGRNLVCRLLLEKKKINPVPH